MDLEKNVQEIDKFLYLFARNFPNETNVTNVINSIKDKVSTVTELGPQNDFKDIEANGYRSALHALSKLLEFTIKLPDRDEQLDVVNYIDWYLKWLLNCNQNNNQLEPLSQEHFNEMLASFMTIRKNLITVHSHFPANCIDGNSRVLIKIGPLITAIHRIDGFWSLIKFAISPNFRKELYLNSIEDANINFFKYAFHFSDYKFMLALGNVIHRLKYRDVQFEEVFPKVSSKWTVQVEGTNIEVKQNGQLTERTVRCKVYQNKSGLSSGKNRKLIFHAHGGGFVAMSPDSHEMYLCEYARQLPDALIVSVDYSLSPEFKFPVALQELLDVYLWFTSGSCPYFKNGPSSIVLTGDSAGGAYVMSLLCLIKDIQTLWPSSGITCPKSIVPIYPIFQVEPTYHPSQLAHTMESTTAPWLHMTLISAYSPTNFNMELKDFTPEGVEKDEQFKKMMTLHKHPYISPIFCDVDKLAGVKMFLISSTTCGLLDQSIVMAKKWAGPVQLDVVDRLPHGFLHTASVCNKSKDAVDLVIRRLNEAL